MGAEVKDFSAEVTEQFGLSSGRRGVVVWSVEEGGPARRAGLRPGDVIESVDSRNVGRAHTLRWQMAARGVGKSMVLQVRRGDQPLKVRVTLEEPPPPPSPTPTVAANRPPPRKPTSSSLSPVLTEEEKPRPLQPYEPVLGPDAEQFP
jgi:serine protease Do